MKHQISIHHLPTGKVFRSKPEDLGQKFEGLKELLVMAAAGKVTYFQIITVLGSEIYFPQSVLKDCVLELEVVSEH